MNLYKRFIGILFLLLTVFGLFITTANAISLDHITITVASCPPTQAKQKTQPQPCESSVDQQDVEALARIIWWEARGDELDGQLAVGQVVLNRVQSELYPDSIEKVIAQKGQFSPYEDRRYFTVDISEACYQAAYTVLTQGYELPEDVLWFRSDRKPATWYSTRFYQTIGGHHFYISD